MYMLRGEFDFQTEQSFGEGKITEIFGTVQYLLRPCHLSPACLVSNFYTALGTLNYLRI